MKLPISPALTILLVVLVSFLAQSRAHQDSDSQDVERTETGWQTSVAQLHTPDLVPTQSKREAFETSQGPTAVLEAWEILQNLSLLPGRKPSASKPSGFFGITWHYAKILFRLLFMNSPAKLETLHTDGAEPRLKGDLLKAVNLLKHAATYNDPDAIFLLAEMNFYGNFSHPRNYRAAFNHYMQLGSVSGNSTAQYMLGLMYATGIGGAVERDQARALLYHTFAAEQGNTRSEMTIAFRHYSGIGTPKSCDSAVQYYKKVADKAMTYWRSGPPGGQVLTKGSYRWADDTGGVYGDGASFVSAGFNANRDGNSHAALDDILEYLDMQERQGNLQATYSLGKHYYEGSRNHKRNVRKAQRQFMKVARAYWGKDGKVNPKGPKDMDKIAAKAAGHIGRMFLRGEGLEQSFEKATTWFRRGIANGDSFCQYHMGLMYRDGLGVPKDGVRAATYFKTAAEQDLPAAQSALGVLFLDQGDLETAWRYFELAARHGFMESFYYLAELTNKGIGHERHCGMAVAYYKLVAERAEIIHSPFMEASIAFEAGDLETALIASIIAAEQGYETAQANVAYLLDERTTVWPVSSIPLLSQKHVPSSSSLLLRNAALALIYWTRSAKQSNVDSLLKMGDYYLSGHGTELSLPDPDKASICYQTAAESHSAQALWNLGWMHENGVGPITQDFHMAKRYYDLALDKNVEAYVPVKLALLKLRFRSWWNGVTGGKINGIQADEDGEKTPSRSFSEWVAHFLEYTDDEMAEQGSLEELELDSLAFGTNDPMPGGDENYDDFDDGLLESLIIIALAATLAFLVYYRQQRQLQNRQAEAAVAVGAPGVGPQGNRRVDGVQQQHAGVEAPADPADPALAPAEGDRRGFFPEPGDPEWGQWVAGGVAQ